MDPLLETKLPIPLVLAKLLLQLLHTLVHRLQAVQATPTPVHPNPLSQIP